MNPQDEADKLLNQMIDATPVLDNPAVADMHDAARARLMQDIANGIYPADELAVRYGLGGIAGLRHWMVRNPECIARIKALKALNQSDANSAEVNRLKANIIIGEALPGASGIIMDSRNPLDKRIDMFKAIQKMAGLDSAPAANKEAAAGATFSLNINFGDRIEKISATVVKEIEAAPAGDDDALPEEDA